LLKLIKFRKSEYNCRDEVTEEWRNINNKKLYALYYSPNIIWVINSRRLKWTGHVARTGKIKSAYWALVGKPEGRKQLTRHRLKWKDNIKVDLREVV
jgi:hypothetical protein